MTTNFWLIIGFFALASCTAESAVAPVGEQGPQGDQGPIGPAGADGPAPTDDDIRGAVGLEILEVDDARLTYEPQAFACNAGEWCDVLDGWSANRLAQNGRRTECEGEADCSANTVELALDDNAHYSVVLSHWDSPQSRVVVVELSFDGGSTYGFHKAINTHRVGTQDPKTSRLHTIASNLPIGADVRVRLKAAKGRMHVEGFALSKMILPESDTRPFRSIARAGGNGPDDDTCDIPNLCGPSAIATRALTFVKTRDDTDVRVQYMDVMRSHSLGGVRRGCRWHIYFDGAPCSSGDIVGLVFADDTSASHPLRSRSIGGYCSSLGAGTHTAQVFVSNAGDLGANCLTGAGGIRWLLEAEEVQ